jgi:hypothetical protein
MGKTGRLPPDGSRTESREKQTFVQSADEAANDPNAVTQGGLSARRNRTSVQVLLFKTDWPIAAGLIWTEVQKGTSREIIKG